MTETEVRNAIEQSVEESVQVEPDVGQAGGVFVVNWLSRAGLTLPPWWSTARDVSLRDFWKQSDHLSGAIYTMTSKMTAIPNKVVARDPSDKDIVSKARILTDILAAGSEFGDGWSQFYALLVEDLLTQDNGTFVEIIGPGRKDGPIVGQPVTVAHLDAARCVRTGNAFFPIIYEDVDGNRHKMHYTRVMMSSQMSSPIKEMFKVGFCAVSRAVNISQTLVDILVFKQEKLGSRPHRQLIITRGGLDPQDLADAFQLAESNMDSQSLTRFSKVVVGGSHSLPEAEIETVDFSSMPDGFDENSSTILGMATIALAFGVDARELFPAMSAGATRADALLQHLKQRGKGPGQIIQTTEQLFNYKFVPPSMQFLFDFQDDAQDRQVAEISKTRSDSRVQDSTTQAIDQRVLRQKMLEDGEIVRDQYERMELDSGRLPDGTTVLALFYSKDRKVAKYLDVGVEDPLDIRNNKTLTVLDGIADMRKSVLDTLINSTSAQERWSATLAQSALNELELGYLNEDTEEEQPAPSLFVDRRIQSEDVTSPTRQEQDTDEQIDQATDTYDDEPE